MARQCSLAEVTAAIAANVSIPNSTKVFHAGQAASEQCLCCADVDVMPEPCSRPYKLSATDLAQDYSFKVDIDEERLCQWVFDSSECSGGVQLRFTEARIVGSVPGDGWRVFAASSPVDLDQVQNLRFSKSKILAEIHDHQSRRFR